MTDVCVTQPMTRRLRSGSKCWIWPAQVGKQFASASLVSVFCRPFGSARIDKNANCAAVMDAELEVIENDTDGDAVSCYSEGESSEDVLASFWRQYSIKYAPVYTFKVKNR